MGCFSYFLSPSYFYSYRQPESLAVHGMGLRVLQRVCLELEAPSYGKREIRTACKLSFGELWPLKLSVFLLTSLPSRSLYLTWLVLKWLFAVAHLHGSGIEARNGRKILNWEALSGIMNKGDTSLILDFFFCFQKWMFTVLQQELS